MPRPLHEALVVRSDVVDQDDPQLLIRSVGDFVYALKDRLVNDDEQAPDALLSIRLDEYLGEVLNGGFSQFVYNTGWNPSVVEGVRAGLRKIGAKKHQAHFDELAAAVDSMSERQLEEYLNSGYFGTNTTRDALSSADDRFFALEEEHPLAQHHAAWLRDHPRLTPVGEAEWNRRVDELAAMIPDTAAREAAARAAAPRYVKLIRALCDEAGQELSHVTAGNPNHEHQTRILGFIPRKVTLVAWHFITDRGHHYMLDLGRRAEMYAADESRLVAAVDARGVS